MTIDQDLQQEDDVVGDVPENEWVDLADPAEKNLADDEPPALYFSNVEVFVRELLAPTYRRNLDLSSAADRSAGACSGIDAQVTGLRGGDTARNA